MKQMIRNVVLSALVVAWAGVAQAENAGAPAGSPKKEAPKAEKMQCEIVKVNAEAKTVDVKVGDKTETLALTDKVVVKVNGEKKALSDLKAGDKCTCTVHPRPKEGGKSVSRIVIGEDKKEAKPKEAK